MSHKRCLNPERDENIYVLPNWEKSTWIYKDEPFYDKRRCSFKVILGDVKVKRIFFVDKYTNVDYAIKINKERVKRDLLEVLANKYGSVYPTQEADPSAPRFLA